MSSSILDNIRSVDELEARLAAPRDGLVDDFRTREGDILILGAGGKLGPSLVRLALNATAVSGRPRRIIAVSRFGKGDLAERLRAAGAEVVSADITDDATLAALPDAPNVVFLVGAKFGSTGNEPNTWYTNAYLPGRVAERYRASSIVALSTGNVYAFTEPGSGGPTELTPPAPVGEYAMSCLGRERVFQHFSGLHGTPLVLIRLNYAVEMRYGVLVDIARAVLEGTPVNVAMGSANVVWQGYANEVVLRALGHCAPGGTILNVAGPETVSVRQVAAMVGRIAGLEPVFAGTEAPTALLSNGGLCHRLFGYPAVPLGRLIEWTVDWLRAGLPLLGKPTGFQQRDGKF